MIFKKLRDALGGKKESQPSAGPREVPKLDLPSAAFKSLMERTRERSLERGLQFENMLIEKYGDNYRLGVDVRKATLAVARAGGQAPEQEFSVYIVGTELVSPEGFSFFWPWAHPMLGLDPFPVWTEYANELQTLGGANEGIHEFITPLLKFQSEEELCNFYMAIQGWGNLDGFYRLPFGQARLVVFVIPGAK